MQIAPSNAYNIAATGIAEAMARFDASAQRTARAPLDDLAAEAVARIEAKTAVQANVAVLRTADDMAGSLLDIMA